LTANKAILNYISGGNTSALIIIVSLLFSCKSDEKHEGTLFSLLSSTATHIDFSNQLTENEEFNIIEYLYFNNGAGVAAGDINNDGLTDLYFTASQLSNKLYLNRGNMEFEDITEKAGVAGKGDWKTGVTLADVNGDGWLDIYVCQVGDYKSLKGRNQLFINHGDLTFTDEAGKFGLDFQGFSTQAAFFDYDIDGDLDMYLLNHSVHSSRNYGRMDLRFEKDDMAGDKIFRNDEVNGKRIFTDVTTEAGILSSQIGYGLAVSISDINNDGYPDIYVSNDFHEDDYLYVNNGNGTFKEMLPDCIEHTSRSSMGNDIADFNNDGLTDILVLDMLPDIEEVRKRSGGEDDYELFNIKLQYGYHNQFVRNTLQLNLGNCLFSEIGQLSGIHSTDWSWSPLFCDLDNDGWKDIFISSGIFRRGNDLDYINYLTGGNRYYPEKDNSALSDRELYEKMPLYPNVNYFFRNKGDLTFERLKGKWDEERSFSNGSAFADLDNDGDLDLIVNRINDKALIYRNETSSSGSHYLSVSLSGGQLNRRGTGARVTVFWGGRMQVAEQYTVRGFMSSSTDVLHFGLGESMWIDSLIIRWPGMREQKLTRTKTDTLIILDIKNAMPSQKRAGPPTPVFSGISIPGLRFTHKEDPYVDFPREPLIPHSLSAEGPALAVGDINGDGLDDVFTGNARGQNAALYVQTRDARFRQVISPLFNQPGLADDVDALFFDADNDGDKDLYIVRGGNEYPVGAAFLQDVLLTNDGKGNFSMKKDFSLSHNGSCVRAADFDGDGDNDLFVGSRSIPGKYGLPPEQFLMRNDGKGNLEDVTSILASGLKNIGMVTDACWADYDSDGDQDLIVAGEWMKISIFRNDNGHLNNATSEAGFDSTSGWWSSIECTDVDRDGDLDIIGGNLGLNSMLKASSVEPVTMYINDFDNNGVTDPILCAFNNGISYPFASLDELGVQIGGLKQRFPTYVDFAGKTVEEIFGENKIEKSIKLKAELFESSLFINNGKGVFSRRQLPMEVQFSPVRDILTGDFNNDGLTDLLLAGNNYLARPSLGRYDASYGWFVAGTDIGFNAAMPLKSGLVINGDARRLSLIIIGGEPYLIGLVNSGPLQVFGMTLR
jgi:hypothetical protein